jgi:hypothetical protein
MSSAQLEPAKWNIRASGNAFDTSVIDRLRQDLAPLQQVERLGVSLLSVIPAARGWLLEVTGASADPGAHAVARGAVAGVLVKDSYQTGSSEFSSPYGSVANFHHTAPVATSDSTGGSSTGGDGAGETAQTGNGGPAWA